MQSKYLLIVLTVVILSSCSTAYQSGQTPDDVYYSPARVIDNESYRERDRDRYQTRYQRADDYEITMAIRDRRWRDFRNDYDYYYSPYNFATCRTINYGYYYNPYYYPWAIYTGRLTYAAPVNTTPRMVNLNAYTGYNSKVASGKTTGTISWTNPSTQYNNSNRSSSSRTTMREILLPRSSNSGSSSSNNSRTYSPSSSGSSGSSSSGSGSSGSPVSRPGRGG